MAERDNQGGERRAILGGETEDKDRALRWLRSSRIPAEIRERVRSYAPLGLPVFLQGEKGTGKSEVARALHFLGPRKEGLLLRLPCRGLTWPKFGERLSLWLKSRPSANAIPLTLYWEDVEFLQEELQALLVDILADRRVPWPGLNERTLDVGVLSSSCLPLADAVSAGKFREDLFWTLETLTLYLPPLRERIPRPDVVQKFSEALVSQPARLSSQLEQLCEAFVSETQDFALGECGFAHDLGEQRHGSGASLPQHCSLHTGRVPRDMGRKGTAQPFELPRQQRAVESYSALRYGLRSERSKSCLLERITSSSCIEYYSQGHERRSAHLGNQYLDSVGESPPLEGREPIRTRRIRKRPLRYRAASVDHRGTPSSLAVRKSN